MPITPDGLELFARALVNNTSLNLCTSEGSPLSQTNNYAPLTCKIGTSTDQQGEAYFSVSKSGDTVTLTNHLFYFSDADDGVSDNISTVLWSNINGIRFGDLYYGEFASPVNVHLFERPKFADNAITITFTSTDASSS